MQKAERGLVLRARVASELMAPDPISIRSEAKATEALTMFSEKGIHAAPVIDEAGRPIGVLSRSDLLVHQVEHAKYRANGPEYFFEPTFGSDATPACNTNPSEARVVDLMTPAVFAVSPDTPVHRVVSDMIGLRVHRLFVVDEDGCLVGVISTMDVLKFLKPEV